MSNKIKSTNAKKTANSQKIKAQDAKRIQQLSKLYEQSRFDEMADLLAKCDLNAAQGEYANLQALCSLATGEYVTAANAAGLAVHHNPDKFVFMFHLALCLDKNKRKDEALVIYRDIIKKFPQDFRVYRNMGVLYEEREDYEAALVCFKKMLDLGGDGNIAACAIAECYLKLGNIPLAAHYCEKALNAGGNLGKTWQLFARVFQSKGDKEGARAAYRKAIEADPQLFGAYGNYVDVGGLSEEELQNVVLKLREALKDRYLNLHQIRVIHFALGKTLHKLKDYDSAFHHYKLGNGYRAKSLGMPFSIESFRKNLNWWCTHIDAGFFDHTRRASSTSQLPVFVVGMPRSGTTLLEQLIASHPFGAGAGELPTIPAIATEIKRGHKVLSQAFKDKIANFPVEQVEKFAQQYLGVLRKYGPDASGIVDKMPHNFLNVWVIALLFPNAPILHCVRDYRSTCLSCFMQDFTTGHMYKTDLETLGRYHFLADKWMEHWRKVVPNPILTVSYEEMVTSQEQSMRKVLAHIGLDWDPACLDTRNREHFSLTASNLQIREGVYTSALKSWEKYASHLKPLIQGFEAEKHAWQEEHL